MPSRGRRLAPAFAAAGAVLFAGHWTAGVLTDRWWAEGISPAAVTFLTGWHVLQLTLGFGGVLIASAWFVGHLLVVYRAIGSVQISRRVANLEIREALTAETLLTGTVIGGLLLGLVTGIAASHWAAEVALAWHGLSYDFAEPLLGHDPGLYVAQLPLWRSLHGFFLLLAVLGLVVCVGLYGVVGAIRWVEGRPAINDHARAHVGWLLVALALALAWGYMLEPYELVAGRSGVPDRAMADLVTVIAPVLTGTALMVALVSAVWATRPRHALVAAGWLVLVLASLAGHYVLPALNRDAPSAAVDPALMRELASLAFGLSALSDTADGHLLRDTSPPSLAPLWDAHAARAAAPDSLDAASVSPAVLELNGVRRPTWLALQGHGSGTITLTAMAADTASSAGDPLWYRAGDAHAYPVPQTVMELADAPVRPGAPAWSIETDGRGRGTAMDPWPRRVMLAWALQIGRLLGDVPAGARLVWRLTPAERLDALLPVAAWSVPVARIFEGRLVWISDGYVSSGTFPLVERVPWRGGGASAVRAGFIGVVWAETGETKVFLRRERDPDPLAEAWASIAAGVVRPAGELPDELAGRLPYPAAQFRVQSIALERAPWSLGVLSGRPEGGTLGGEPRIAEPGWAPDSSDVRRVAIYERPAGRRVSAVVAGVVRRGMPILDVMRTDSTDALPAPRVLDATWTRFPPYERLADSVRTSGARGDSITPGALTLWRDGGTLGAYRPYYAPHSGGGGPALVWVSVWQGERRGAGRTLAAAWDNLEGASVPLPPTVPAAELEAARRWVRLADSALRIGDWAEFGRAFDALRRTLGASPDSTVLRDSASPRDPFTPPDSAAP